MSENLRHYRMEDEAMLVLAQTMHDNLVEDQAVFQAAFPAATPAASAAFQTDINAAAAFPLHQEVNNEIQVLSADFLELVKQGKEALRQLGRYAIEAFPNDPARQRAFGQDDWPAAYNDTDKMRDALEHARDKAVSAPYSAALNSAGFTTAMANNLGSIALAIVDGQNQKKLAQSERPVNTADRIAGYNKVWETMQMIHNRAQLVWAQDPARRGQYKLSAGKK